jgi:hypothetical protein
MDVSCSAPAGGKARHEERPRCLVELQGCAAWPASGAKPAVPDDSPDQTWAQMPLRSTVPRVVHLSMVCFHFSLSMKRKASPAAYNPPFEKPTKKQRCVERTFAKQVQIFRHFGSRRSRMAPITAIQGALPEFDLKNSVCQGNE